MKSPTASPDGGLFAAIEPAKSFWTKLRFLPDDISVGLASARGCKAEIDRVCSSTVAESQVMMKRMPRVATGIPSSSGSKRAGWKAQPSAWLKRCRECRPAGRPSRTGPPRPGPRRRRVSSNARKGSLAWLM